MNKSGWRKVKFGEVVRLSKARCANPLAEGIERFVGLEHLQPGDLRIRSWGNVADGTTFTSVFKPGQVLFGKRRAYQRKVAVADFSGVCSGDIYVLESLDANVLLNQIKANAYEFSLQSKTHNFPAALPAHLAEQASEALKSRYSLEFLGIAERLNSKDGC